MSATDASPLWDDAGDGQDHGHERRRLNKSRQRNGWNGWLILKRKQRLMVLFRVHPPAEIAAALGQLDIQIGLALTADQLLEEGWTTGLAYLFIGTRSRPGTVFRDALRDLTRNGWTLDQDATLPVIIDRGAVTGTVGQRPLARLEA